MPSQFRPRDPLDASLLPFVPDREPRFILSIPFSNVPPFMHTTDPFPLPRLTATSSEQDVARQLLGRSPSPSTDRPNAIYGPDHCLGHKSPAELDNAYELGHRLDHEPLAGQDIAHQMLAHEPLAAVNDLTSMKRPRSRSPSRPSSSMHDPPSVSVKGTPTHLNRKERLKPKEKSPAKTSRETRSNRPALGEPSKRRRVLIPDVIDPLYANPRQRKIYDWGTFTWYEAQGHEALLAPPAPPTNPRTIIHDGDIMVYKLLDNSSAQVWLWDENGRELNRWRSVEHGQTHDIRGRNYVFEFGKDFSPHWTSRLTIERRAQRRVRTAFP